MDERTDPSAAFALRLSADLISALVATGTISKNIANALVDDSLLSILASHPEYEPALREIAAVLTAQVQFVAMDVERKTREKD